MMVQQQNSLQRSNVVYHIYVSDTKRENQNTHKIGNKCFATDTRICICIYISASATKKQMTTEKFSMLLKCLFVPRAKALREPTKEGVSTSSVPNTGGLRKQEIKEKSLQNQESQHPEIREHSLKIIIYNFAQKPYLGF